MNNKLSGLLWTASAANGSRSPRAHPAASRAWREPQGYEHICKADTTTIESASISMI